MRIKTGEEVLHDLPKFIVGAVIVIFVMNVAAAVLGLPWLAWTFGR
jgi:hypothetical protein